MLAKCQGSLLAKVYLQMILVPKYWVSITKWLQCQIHMEHTLCQLCINKWLLCPITMNHIFCQVSITQWLLYQIFMKCTLFHVCISKWLLLSRSMKRNLCNVCFFKWFCVMGNWCLAYITKFFLFQISMKYA